MKTTFKKLVQRTGVTLTELLVVLVIISILSTIAVPVYTQHSERARRATAITEAREIAMAQETVGALHGFYVPLQLLDDLPGGVLANDVQSTGEEDAIGEESGSINVVDFKQNFFDLNSGQPQLNDFSTDSRIDRLLNEWDGPYMTFQRYYVNPSSNNPTQDGTTARGDFPLDPWGNPYRFFSPIGLIGSSANDPLRQISLSTFSDGTVTTQDDVFDRYAIVSYGPDGDSPGSSNTGIGGILDENDDDIYYLFGTVNAARTETAFAPLP